MEKSRNKQFLSFKLSTILSSMMKYCISLLHPIHSVNHSFVQCIPLLFAPYLLATQ